MSYARPDGLIRALVGLVLILAVALILGACTPVVIVQVRNAPAGQAGPPRPAGPNPCATHDCSRPDTRRIV